MNNKRYIRQYDFNNITNGYRSWYDGDYVTYVTGRLIGLEFWYYKLRYYIG